MNSVAAQSRIRAEGDVEINLTPIYELERYRNATLQREGKDWNILQGSDLIIGGFNFSMNFIGAPHKALHQTPYQASQRVRLKGLKSHPSRPPNYEDSPHFRISIKLE